MKCFFIFLLQILVDPCIFYHMAEAQTVNADGVCGLVCERAYYLREEAEKSWALLLILLTDKASGCAIPAQFMLFVLMVV